MKKRYLAFLLSLCILFTLLPIGASAADDVVWSTLDNDTVLAVSCDGAMPNYSAENPAAWSYLKSTVKTVIVKDGVTDIGQNAFSGFTALEHISIPASVCVIGEYAFSGCTALAQLTIPDGVVTIGSSAFSDCSSLKTLTLPKTIKIIKQNAFKGTDLRDVYFGGTNAVWSVVKANTEQGNDALFTATKHVICETHTTERQNVVKPTCTEKGYSGDDICKVCGTVVSVGKEVPAFGHDWLKWKVRAMVSEYQDGLERRICYNDNSHVEEVRIPAGTTYKPAQAELLNEATESITVPNTRGNIIWLKWVSEGMPAAREETVNPFSDVNYGDSCYDAVLWAVDRGILTASSGTLSPFEMVTCQEACAITGAYVSSEYDTDIPHAVTYMTNSCEWVIPLPTEVSDANFVYIISSDQTTIGIKLYKGTDEKVRIPDKVGGLPITLIRDGAFQNKTKVTDVTIPATVTSIGADAFNGCSKLASINIPGADTVIGARAFKGCQSLTNVVVPMGATSIGSEAFSGCTKLASITLPRSLETLASNAFYNDPALRDIYYQGGAQSWDLLGYQASPDVTVHFDENASPLTWEIQNGTAIVTGCLKSYTGDLVIPYTLDGVPVVEIADSAFRGCGNLTSVNVPEAVTLIGAYAFNDCVSLRTVTLPKSLVKIDGYAFDGSNVKDVYYGGTLNDWNNVVIKSGNDPVKIAILHPADCDEHRTELRNVMLATCTDNGYTGDEVCTVCGKTIKTGEEVPSLGHAWGDWTVTQAPTATEPGLETRVCMRDETHVEICEIAPIIPLAITASPADSSGAVGQVAAFAVRAEGSNLTYRWQFSDDNGETWQDSGMDSAVAVCTIRKDLDGRLYRCVVSDAYGNAEISGSAKLRCMQSLTILKQPEDAAGKVNTAISFSVLAEGDGLTYQWQLSDNGGKKWTNSSVKTPEYSTKLTAARDGRLVRCIVSDQYGNSITSDAAAMRVYRLSITSQPENYVGPVNSTAVFSVSATGEGLSYQWQFSDNGGKKWTNSSVKADTYSTKLSAARDGRLVRCIVTDESGNTVTSDTAEMRVYQLTITLQPEDYVGKVNSVAAFQVEAQGDGLSYQWQISDNDGQKWYYSSVISEVYTSKLSAKRDGRLVRCIVTDSSGNTVTSNAARMTIE